MKILLTILISLFALSAQAQTTFEHFTAHDEWPALSEFGNIIVPGDFYCTGGGEPIDLFACAGGKGIHIRSTQMISDLSSFNPVDPRIDGIVWFDIAANWDSDYTGPVIGNWSIDPFAYLEDPTTYWEGTYVGKREIVPDPTLPYGVQKWVTTLKLEGYGMGALDGQQMKATEVITTFSQLPMPWELLGLDPAGPEGVAEITIITED